MDTVFIEKSNFDSTILVTIISSLVTIGVVFLTFYLNIQNSKKNIKLESIKEINVVIANMLDVWYVFWQHYRCLQVITSQRKDIFFPFKDFLLTSTNSNLINKNCFDEFETSVTLIKKYNPIVHYKISGIATEIRKIQMYYFDALIISPKMQANMVSKKDLKLIEDCMKHFEELTLLVAKYGNGDLYDDVNNVFKSNYDKDLNKFINEIQNQYFKYIKSILPFSDKSFTLKDFKAEMQKAEVKELLISLLNEVSKVSDKPIEYIFEVLKNNPGIKTDEFLEKIKNSTYNE